MLVCMVYTHSKIQTAQITSAIRFLKSHDSFKLNKFALKIDVLRHVYIGYSYGRMHG